MSVEAWKAFGAKVMEDEELKAKAKEIGLENVDGIITLAKENGFDVTLEGLEALAKELQPKEELDEDELDQVAGGFFALEAVLVAGIVAATAGAVAMSAQVGIASSKNW